jgi:hypothetical protein
VKEIKSIATGCKIAYQDLLLLNYIYDLYGGGCTTIVFNNERYNPVIGNKI